MKKLTFFLTALMIATASMAQSTARRFVLSNSADGQSELTVYLPTAEAAAKANGRAVVDCPGGGYTHLSMENEGHNWAEFYNSRGIAYVVLKYRMPNGDRNIPLGDAYNAIRTVRDSAAVWNINPKNIGIMGFSAGGHLASSVSTHAEDAVRPDFSILFYPVISMNEYDTHKGSCVGFLGDKRNDPELQAEWSNYNAVKKGVTPPAIILLASDDRAVPPLTNGLKYYAALLKEGINATFVAYPSGGHGFGIKNTFRYHDEMMQELSKWLETLRVPAPEK